MIWVCLVWGTIFLWICCLCYLFYEEAKNSKEKLSHNNNQPIDNFINSKTLDYRKINNIKDGQAYRYHYYKIFKHNIGEVSISVPDFFVNANPKYKIDERLLSKEEFHINENNLKEYCEYQKKLESHNKAIEHLEKKEPHPCVGCITFPIGCGLAICVTYLLINICGVNESLADFIIPITIIICPAIVYLFYVYVVLEIKLKYKKKNPPPKPSNYYIVVKYLNEEKIIDQCYDDFCRIIKKMQNYIYQINEHNKQISEYSKIQFWKGLNPDMFECEVGKWFERQGYQSAVTELKAGGGDGGIDIVLKKNGVITFVQCKRWNKGDVDVKVVRELKGVMSIYNVENGIIVYIQKITKNAIDEAKKAGIRLINVNELIKGQQQTKYIPRSDDITYHKKITYVGSFSIFSYGFIQEENARQYATLLTLEGQKVNRFWDVIKEINTYMVIGGIEADVKNFIKKHKC